MSSYSCILCQTPWINYYSRRILGALPQAKAPYSTNKLNIICQIPSLRSLRAQSTDIIRFEGGPLTIENMRHFLMGDYVQYELLGLVFGP